MYPKNMQVVFSINFVFKLFFKCLSSLFCNFSNCFIFQFSTFFVFQFGLALNFVFQLFFLFFFKFVRAHHPPTRGAIPQTVSGRAEFESGKEYNDLRQRHEATGNERTDEDGIKSSSCTADLRRIPEACEAGGTRSGRPLLCTMRASSVP